MFLMKRILLLYYLPNSDFLLTFATEIKEKNYD